MSNTKPSIEELSFDDIRTHYRVGRKLSEGQGRYRKYSYWFGVQTNLGEIELSEWTALAWELIKRKGEQALFEQLFEFVKKSHGPNWKDDMKQYALELHCSRIFDRPGWVNYLPFNRRYRPESIQTEGIMMIIPSCCPEPGEIMRQQLWSNLAPCPHCGRHTEYIIIDTRSFVADINWIE